MYFIQDPLDSDWRIVRDVEPRSCRVTANTEEEPLSAPGRADATTNLSNPTDVHPVENDPMREPVLEADVAHVLAHEESNDEGGHEEDDDEDGGTEEEDNSESCGNDTELQHGLEDFADYL